MNGAQRLVQLLKSHGVSVVFGYPGGAIMPIYDALFDGGLEHLLCRHEQGAIFSAIGYARATGKVGVCFATSGPGATNLVTGLADALLDSVPIIAITGQVGLSLIGTDAFQEVDVLGLSLACTKHSFLVESLCALPYIIDQAFIIASTGRPGPVLIDIPKDIQLLNDNNVICTASQSSERFCITRDNKIKSNLETAFLLISKSSRPVLYVGGGVGIAGAVLKLRDFIRITGIPVVVTLKGLGSVDYNDCCYLGMLGMHGNQAANFVVQRCDLLIAVGARFDDRVTGQVDSFAPEAKIIHLDIDPSEFNKLRRADVTLLGDLNYLLDSLSQELFLDKWRLEVKNLKTRYRWLYDNNVVDQSISAPSFLKYVSDHFPNDTVVTTDVGQHQMWVAQHVKFNYPKNFITSSGLGSMGFGIPAAIGAQIGRPESTVVCVSGDGSFMMNVQELGTIKRKKLPIKIILLDNQRLGMVRQWQELFFDKRYCETSLFDNPNFVMLAKSFEISAVSICSQSQILDSVRALFADSVPFLLHVIINEFDNVWPLVPPGAANDVMLDRQI